MYTCIQMHARRSSQTAERERSMPEGTPTHQDTQSHAEGTQSRHRTRQGRRIHIDIETLQPPQKPAQPRRRSERSQPAHRWGSTAQGTEKPHRWHSVARWHSVRRHPEQAPPKPQPNGAQMPDLIPATADQKPGRVVHLAQKTGRVSPRNPVSIGEIAECESRA